ncbi:transporter [Altericroceibacterium xinjiangense]|uniref:transporter n=1 Tax=Altericroceibacterium xinjiangense TaxID=762261 RepID=UPI000F7E07F1|nr:transporter [Altericroceibacterium xinjiangense]
MLRATAAFALALMAAASPALAQEQERPFCPSRPGPNTPACTIAPGRVAVEFGFADWQRDDQADLRTDTLRLGDTLVRVGVSETVEVLVGWVPFGRVRTRNAVTGAVDSVSRTGDVLVGAKANLQNPDGSGFSVAVQPFALLPVGRQPVGAGDWGAGVLVPMSYDLGDGLSLQFSPQIDAATDSDGSGRHLAYSAAAGLGVTVSEAIGLSAEVLAGRDHDPDGRTTPLSGTLTAAWFPSPDQQFDVGATVGLNDAPDVGLSVGYSHLF